MARGLHQEGDRQPDVRLVRSIPRARRLASLLPLRPPHAPGRCRRVPLAGEHRAGGIQCSGRVVLDLAAADAAPVLLRIRRRRADCGHRSRAGAGASSAGDRGPDLGASAPVCCVTLRDRAVTNSTEARALVGSLGLVSLLGYAVGLPLLSTGSLRTHVAYIVLFSALFLVYLTATRFLLHGRPDDRIVLGLVLAFGLLFRVAVLGSPVILSSDLYRYLWDGRVQWAGVSPYRYPPAATELAPLRDEAVYPYINRPTKVTVYPPGAETVFALVARVAPDSIVAWRAFLLASEIVTVVLLIALLRRTRSSPAAVIVYAWSPLVVFEGVQAGHVDLVMIPLVLAALAFRQGGSSVRAGIALGAAVLVKLYPLVMLPAWWRPRDWRFPAAVTTTVALGYLPHVATVGFGAAGFLPEYLGRAEDHNIGLRALLTYPLGLTGEFARAVAMAVLFALMGGIVVWIGRANPGDVAGMTRAGALAVGTYLLLVPTSMHPWYVLWIVPFLCFSPWPAWLYFSGAVSVSYLSYVVEPAPIPWWAWLAEYGPLLALLFLSGWRTIAHRIPTALAPRTL